MKQSRGKRRPRRAAADKQPSKQTEASTGSTPALSSSGAPRASRFSWIAPVLLLAIVATGIWYFVFRDDRSSEVDELVRQARAAMGTFEYGRAERLLQDAIAIAPGSGTLHHNLGVAYLRQGRVPEARRELEIAARLYGPEANEVRAEENWQLAQIDFQEEKWREAEVHLVRAIQDHPTRMVLHHRLIDLQLAALSKQGAADSSTMRFLQFCGTTPENLRDSAHIHFKRKSYSSAIALARRAVAASDTMITAHAILARSHWRAGYLQEALELLEGPMQRYPMAVDLWVIKGSVLVGERRTDEALEALEHALVLDPDSYDGNVAKMMALFVGGDYEEAIVQANHCRTLTENEDEQRFLRGQLGRFEEALQGHVLPDSIFFDPANVSGEQQP